MAERSQHYGCKHLPGLIAFGKDDGPLPPQCETCARLTRADNFECAHPDDLQQFLKQEALKDDGTEEIEYFIKCKICSRTQAIDKDSFDQMREALRNNG